VSKRHKNYDVLVEAPGLTGEQSKFVYKLIVREKDEKEKCCHLQLVKFKGDRAVSVTDPVKVPQDVVDLITDVGVQIGIAVDKAAALTNKLNETPVTEPKFLITHEYDDSKEEEEAVKILRSELCKTILEIEMAFKACMKAVNTCSSEALLVLNYKNGNNSGPSG
jgi:hypothetical protein